MHGDDEVRYLISVCVYDTLSARRIPILSLKAGDFVMRIEEIDTNFAVETSLKIDNIAFYDVRQAPFEVCGVFHENGRFRRMPEAVAKTVNPGVYRLHTYTAGGRVRFKTDSAYIAIHAKMGVLSKMPHMPLAGSAGFDLYLRENGRQIYLNSFIPPVEVEGIFEMAQNVGSHGLREYIINMPLYGGVDALYIGVDKNAVIEAPAPYAITTPFVFYGSSITEGGCASRPGTCYQGHISRRFDCDYINLGFSGCARGEDEIAEYIKDLPMSAFIYDYDYNAPSAEHLEKTHARMFLTIRNAQPTLPIVMMTRPKFLLTEEDKMRVCIIKKTYDNALAAGDKNVYFIPGEELMALTGNEGTVDGVHPNDLGFFSMAQKLGDVLETVFSAR